MTVSSVVVKNPNITVADLAERTRMEVGDVIFIVRVWAVYGLVIIDTDEVCAHTRVMRRNL